MTKLLTILMLLTSVQTFACSEDGKDGFLPPNRWSIPVHTNRLYQNNMTEDQFNDLIDEVERVYTPIVSSLGGKLNVVRKWEDGTVNAYANRSGNTYNVHMFGGLARHKAITVDGMSLVVCHELGHHIGGAPKYNGGPWGGNNWASNEGQADYFATLKCLRKVWRNQNTRAIVNKYYRNAPKALVDACASTFKDADENAVCIRSGMAGLSTATLFQMLRNETKAPDFTTPDPAQVSKTADAHPATQCRLDTYFQGAICEIQDTVDVDQKDEVAGTCYRANGMSKGVRPFCWFKPRKQ